MILRYIVLQYEWINIAADIRTFSLVRHRLLLWKPVLSCQLNIGGAA